MLDSCSSITRSLSSHLLISQSFQTLGEITHEEVESIQVRSQSMLHTRRSNFTLARGKEMLKIAVPSNIKAEDTEKDFYFLLNNSKPFGVSDYTQLLYLKLESLSKEIIHSRRMNLQSLILSVIQNREGSISLQKSFSELPVECFKILLNQVNYNL